MKRVGIFGGSFDPVHKEHFNMAKSAIKELDLDLLLVVPTYKAPHKTGAVASDKDRFNMLLECFKNEPKIVVSPYEIDDAGVSYSYLTVNHFKNLYKESELFFLVGSDMLSSFLTWKNPQVIVDNATLVLTSRTGVNESDKTAILEVENALNTKIKVLNYLGLGVSSTQVRVYSALGLDIGEFVVKGVSEYIKNNNLYSGNYLYKYINKNLPTKRKIHTAGVILTALSLAKKLKVDLQKVETAALLHDVAKYQSLADYPNFKLEENVPKPIEHQFLGAHVAKTVLNITDEEVLDAIRYHSTGKTNMSLLSKIIYVSDLIEPNRKYAGVEELRQKIYEDFDKGFAFSTQEVLSFLEKGGEPIYYLAKDVANYYKGEIL